MKEKDKIEEALLEAVWFMRWNEDETALNAVLDSKEALQIVQNIFKELDKAGYKIVKKEILN